MRAATAGRRTCASSLRPTRSIALNDHSNVVTVFFGDLLGDNFDGQLSVFFDLVLEGEDESPDKLLAVVERNQLICHRSRLDDLVELDKGLSAQVSILHGKQGQLR